MVCSFKHGYLLLGVGDKVWESYRWKYVFSFYWYLESGKQETQTLNILNTEDQWVQFVVKMLLLYSLQEKAK